MAPQVGQTGVHDEGRRGQRAAAHAAGLRVHHVTGRQDPYIPKLDEVKTKVRDDVLKQKAIDAARQKAASINAALKSGDFEKAAKAAGLEVKTTELITRGAPMGDAGVEPGARSGGVRAARGRGERSGRHRQGRRRS